MSVFYDPKKKAVKGWVFVCFIIIPIVLFVISLVTGRQIADMFKAKDQAQQEPDIFK